MAATAAKIHRCVAEYLPATYIVGLPLNMDASEGPQAALTRRFADELRAATGATVELFDERLSSAAADEALKLAGATRGQRATRRDALAAQTMLQAYLDQRPRG